MTKLCNLWRNNKIDYTVWDKIKQYKILVKAASGFINTLFMAGAMCKYYLSSILSFWFKKYVNNTKKCSYEYNLSSVSLNSEKSISDKWRHSTSFAVLNSFPRYLCERRHVMKIYVCPLQQTLLLIEVIFHTRTTMINDFDSGKKCCAYGDRLISFITS